MGQTKIYDIGGLPKANEGGLYDLSPKTVDSKVVADNTEVPFGVMVAKGTNDDDAILPASAGATMIGVVLHSHAVARDFGTFTQGLGASGLDKQVGINVLRSGRVWVKVEQDVTQEDRAYVRFAAKGLNTQLGAFRKDADLNGTFATAVSVAGQVKFLASAKAGELVPIAVDMLNVA